MNQEGLFQKAWHITKMPARDTRYKVTADDVKRMQQLSEQGMGQTAIARLLQEEGIPVSTGIVHYWVNEASRNSQRLKNAKRTYVPGSAENQARIARDMVKRKKNWEVDPDMRLRHAIQSAKDEKRVQRKTIGDMSMGEAEELLNSGKLQRPNLKIPEDI